MPRVAFFPDSFHEVNGVAHTARQFVAYAGRHGLPMLCVRAGGEGSRTLQEGTVRVLELDRGHWAFRVEQDLSFDPFFSRHVQAVGQALRAFRPEVIHVTGPSELGLLGVWFAWRLGVPLAASWHTNVHEYAGRRLLGHLPPGRIAAQAGQKVEAATMALLVRLYRRAAVLYAPNLSLCRELAERTGRACHLMQRGVDSALFSPAKRRRGFAGPLRLGYVGRLSAEKNVALLPVVHAELRRQRLDVQWTIVGHGAEERGLRLAMGADAVFAGVLRGEALAEAYADLDLLVFPSHTDTFGNVVLEALASGVPAVVTPDGGPAYIVQHGVTGVVAADEDFAAEILRLAGAREALDAMRGAARSYAEGCSWEAVFDRVLAAYPVERTVPVGGGSEAAAGQHLAKVDGVGRERKACGGRAGDELRG